MERQFHLENKSTIQNISVTFIHDVQLLMTGRKALT